MANLKRHRVSVYTHIKIGNSEVRKGNLQNLLAHLDKTYEQEVVRLRLFRKDVIAKFQKSRP